MEKGEVRRRGEGEDSPADDDWESRSRICSQARQSACARVYCVIDFKDLLDEPKDAGKLEGRNGTRVLVFRRSEGGGADRSLELAQGMAARCTRYKFRKS